MLMNASKKNKLINYYCHKLNRTFFFIIINAKLFALIIMRKT